MALTRARIAIDQSSGCKSGLVCVGTSFLRLLKDPWEIKFVSSFSGVQDGGLILVSWAALFPLYLTVLFICCESGAEL